MIFDIDKTLVPQPYKLQIMRPDTSPIFIQDPKRDFTQFQYNPRFDTFNEITFSVPRYKTVDGTVIENRHWNDFRGDYLIYLSNNNVGDDIEATYIITDVTNSIADKDIKNITAYTLEYEFVYKKIRNYRSEVAGEIETKTLHEILSDVLPIVDNTWSIGYIDPDVASKYRQYDVSESTLWDFFTSLQKSFGCIFQYDTKITDNKINRVINVFDATAYQVCPTHKVPLYYQDNAVYCPEGDFVKQIYGRDSGLYINDRKYIKSFDSTDDHKQIVTRLNVYGKDDLSIREINPTGQPYLEDYTYYRNTDYMSDNLLEALDRYDDLIEQNKTAYQNLLVQKKILEDDLIVLMDGASTGNNLLIVMELLLTDARTLFNQYLSSGDIDYFNQANEKINQLDNSMNTISLHDYGLNQLKEASNIFQKRIDVIVEVEENNRTSDISPTITLTDYWPTNTKLTFSMQNPNDPSSEISETVYLSANSIQVAIPLSLYNSSFRLYLYVDDAIQSQDYQYSITQSGSYYYVNKLGQNILPLKWRVDELIVQKQALVDNKQSQIISVNTEILQLQQLLAKENNFTPDEIYELNFFVREKTHQNNDIGTSAPVGSSDYLDDLSVLMNDAENAFINLWKPPLQFSTNIIDFLDVVECQRDWDKLGIGDVVYIKHHKLDNKYYLVRLIGYVHDPIGNTLTLDLSTADHFNNPTNFAVELFKSTISSSSILSINSNSWNNSRRNAVSDILSSAWDAAKNAVIAGSNQQTVIDGKGINLRSSLPANNGHELRIMNNMIAFTNDGWQTVQNAITPVGVFAEYLVGKFLVGENLWIEATQDNGNFTSFKVDQNGVLLNNASMTITKTSGSVGNGVLLDPTSGITITNDAGTFEIRMSAQDGLQFNKIGSGGARTPVLEFDITGEGYMDGDLRVRQLFIRDNNVEQLINNITTGFNDKISGEVLQGNYISAIGTDGITRFDVDGQTGAVSIRDGDLTITKGNTTIYINPTDGIRMSTDGEDVFYVDSTGKVTFAGSIDTMEDVRVGKDIYLRATTQDGFNTGGIIFQNSSSNDIYGIIRVIDSLSPRFTISSPTNGYVDILNISQLSGNSKIDILAPDGVYINGTRVG